MITETVRVAQRQARQAYEEELAAATPAELAEYARHFAAAGDA